jgi:rhamnopyranosyl-N-acetylglucosaminyl-diphospho-decaprenol beta-1,3/1,4-galactofuranosyltransferase
MPPRSESDRIFAVVVTRNRLALLKECVAALRSQSRGLDQIVVVDNGSTDCTEQWLASAGVTVFRQDNLGGAGGFWRGIKEAWALGADWVWCMDDDSVPTSDALERLVASSPFADPATGFLSSLVLWTDGQVHQMNMLPPAYPPTWTHRLLSDRVMPVARGTFVGMLIARRAVEAVGLPFREFVIWGDDTEYSRRILTRFAGLQVLDSVIIHKTAENRHGYTYPVPRESYWKFLRGLRNDLYIARTDPAPLTGLKFAVLLFGGVFVRTFLRKVPMTSFWWLLKGVFFNPKIEYISVSRAQPASRLAGPLAGCFSPSSTKRSASGADKQDSAGLPHE